MLLDCLRDSVQEEHWEACESLLCPIPRPQRKKDDDLEYQKQHQPLLSAPIIPLLPSLLQPYPQPPGIPIQALNKRRAVSQPGGPVSSRQQGGPLPGPGAPHPDLADMSFRAQPSLTGGPQCPAAGQDAGQHNAEAYSQHLQYYTHHQHPHQQQQQLPAGAQGPQHSASSAVVLVGSPQEQALFYAQYLPARHRQPGAPSPMRPDHPAAAMGPPPPPPPQQQQDLGHFHQHQQYHQPYQQYQQQQYQGALQPYHHGCASPLPQPQAGPAYPHAHAPPHQQQLQAPGPAGAPGVVAPLPHEAPLPYLPPQPNKPSPRGPKPHAGPSGPPYPHSPPLPAGGQCGPLDPDMLVPLHQQLLWPTRMGPPPAPTAPHGGSLAPSGLQQEQQQQQPPFGLAGSATAVPVAVGSCPEAQAAGATARLPAVCLKEGQGQAGSSLHTHDDGDAGPGRSREVIDKTHALTLDSEANHGHRHRQQQQPLQRGSFRGSAADLQQQEEHTAAAAGSGSSEGCPPQRCWGAPLALVVPHSPTVQLAQAQARAQEQQGPAPSGSRSSEAHSGSTGVSRSAETRASGAGDTVAAAAGGAAPAPPAPPEGVAGPPFCQQQQEGQGPGYAGAVYASPGQGPCPWYSNVWAAIPPGKRVAFSSLHFGPQVGEGGFGKVYQGSWQGQEVAIKLLSAAGSPDAAAQLVEQFSREVSTMTSLPEHPNVLKLLGVAVEPPHLALVTEYCARGSLYGLLHTPGFYMSWAEVAQLLLGAARGMAHLHGCQALHRDLKSGNVLVDGTNCVKVADFGLSRLQQGTATLTGGLGTYQWMAPEVLANQRYSHRADVYSFGVVMWECTSRRLPYEGLNGVQAALAVMSKGMRPDIPQQTPPALAALIRDCWAPVPEQRPAFSAVASRLEEIVGQLKGEMEHKAAAGAATEGS